MACEKSAISSCACVPRNNVAIRSVNNSHFEFGGDATRLRLIGVLERKRVAREIVFGVPQGEESAGGEDSEARGGAEELEGGRHCWMIVCVWKFV